ncbi:MAG TPA: type II secretion system protein [Patescibacteria group bacterium]
MKHTAFSHNQKGFTLIELIVVFSIMSILALIGIAGFVTYSRVQALNNAVADIKTILASARSYTGSQVSTTCPSGQSFTGYQVRFCTTYSGSTKQVCGQCSANADYELDLVCNNTIVYPSVVTKRLPAGVRVNGTLCQNFQFNPISSSVVGSGNIIVQYNITGYVKSQTISVTSAGLIQ